MKKIMYLMIFLMLSTIASAVYVKDHHDCGITYQSQNCAASKNMCAYVSSILYCEFPATVNATMPNTHTEVTSNNYNSSLGGRYVYQCEYGSNSNCNTWLCQRDSSCFNVNRKTNCTGVEPPFVCSDCRSGYTYCDGSHTDGDGCEINVGSTSYPGETQAHYDISCNPECNSGRLDCDGDLGSAGTGCEINNGGACTVGELSGVYSGCSGGSGNCIVSTSHHITGTEAAYSSVNPNLWTTQYNSLGWLANFTYIGSVNATFGINSSGCIIWSDGTSTCTNPSGGSGGGGTNVLFDEIYLNNQSNTIFYNESKLNATILDLTKSTTYNISECNLESGNTNEGNNESLKLIMDGNSLNITEETGMNPIVLVCNFTNITDFNSVIYRVWYDGGGGHDIHIGIRQCSDGTYEEEYGEITDMSQFSTTNDPVLDVSNHICGGNVSVKFRHEQAGNINHIFRIDYLVLLDGFSTTTNSEHDAGTGREDFDTNHPPYRDKINANQKNISTINITYGSLISNLQRNISNINITYGSLISDLQRNISTINVTYQLLINDLSRNISTLNETKSDHIAVENNFTNLHTGIEANLSNLQINISNNHLAIEQVNNSKLNITGGNVTGGLTINSRLLVIESSNMTNLNVTESLSVGNRIGIGIEKPTDSLHTTGSIRLSQGEWLKWNSSNGNNRNIMTFNDDDDLLIRNPAPGEIILDDANVGIRTRNPTHQLSINQTINISSMGDINTSGDILTSGQIGIGTLNPSNDFDVQRNFGTDGNTIRNVMSVGRTYTGGAGADGIGGTILYRAETETEGIIQNLASIGAVSTDATEDTVDGALVFNTVTDGGGLTEKIRIITNGNMGIGTETPSHKLNVIGNANFTEETYFGNGIQLRRDAPSEEAMIHFRNASAEGKLVWKIGLENTASREFGDFLIERTNGEVAPPLTLKYGQDRVGIYVPRSQVIMSRLEVDGRGELNNKSGLTLARGSDSQNDLLQMFWSRNNQFGMGFTTNSGTSYSPYLNFTINNFKINIAGKGRFSVDPQGDVVVSDEISAGTLKFTVQDTGATEIIRIVDSSNTCDFGVDGSGWTPSCTSDNRTKHNITNVSQTRINQITDYVLNHPIQEYTWNRNNEREVGAVAQDIQRLYPNKVTEEYNNETNTITLKWYPPTTNDLKITIREQQKQINTLEQRIIILEGRR